MKIPLFDIDATLLKNCTHIHKDSFDYAFKTVYGVDASVREIVTAGMIDTQILLEVLKLHKYPLQKAKDKLPEAINVMRSYFDKHKNEGIYIPLPGAFKLLKRLKDDGFIIGVLTGNIEEIAWTKLEKINLRQFVDFGVFGNMALKRSDLVPFALQKADKITNKKKTYSDLVIIGDSIGDVKCAKDNKCHCIAVTTGLHSKDKLEKAKADLIVSSLNQYDDIVNYLKN